LFYNDMTPGPQLIGAPHGNFISVVQATEDFD
jgi:hypothetical protein